MAADPLEAGGRGEGKGAGSAPRTASPTTLQTGFQLLTKDFLEILDGRHPPGGSQLESSSPELTQGAPDQHEARKLRLGLRRG